MLAKAKARAEAAKATADERAKERRAIAAARDERQAKRAEEKAGRRRSRKAPAAEEEARRKAEEEAKLAAETARSAKSCERMAATSRPSRRRRAMPVMRPAKIGRKKAGARPRHGVYRESSTSKLAHACFRFKRRG